MKICILGAGVIGLTAAWELAERGHEVLILDRQREPGAETSFANAAQLAYTYVAPLASPALLRKLPALLVDPAAPIRVRPSLDPAFLRWCLGFLAACTSARERATTAAMLALAASSRDVLAGLSLAEKLEFGLRTAGKLVLYRKAGTFECARRQVEPGQRVLAGADCLALEPSLRLGARDIAGGIFSPGDQLGDCHAFCGELAERLRRRNAVTWHMGTRVRRPIVKQGRLRAVETDAGAIDADLFVLCFGPESQLFARAAGIRLPIYPMKGYSITARPAVGAAAPNHSVTDFDRKMAYAPLRRDGADVVRATGGADLVGLDRRLDPKRLALFTRHASEMLALDLETDSRPWAGLRPSTPDGRPIIGPSPLPACFSTPATARSAGRWPAARRASPASSSTAQRPPSSRRGFRWNGSASRAGDHPKDGGGGCRKGPQGGGEPCEPDASRDPAMCMQWPVQGEDVRGPVQPCNRRRLSLLVRLRPQAPLPAGPPATAGASSCWSACDRRRPCARRGVPR